MLIQTWTQVWSFWNLKCKFEKGIRNGEPYSLCLLGLHCYQFTFFHWNFNGGSCSNMLLLYWSFFFSAETLPVAPQSQVSCRASTKTTNGRHKDHHMSKRDASHNDRVKGGRRHSNQRDPVVSGGGGHRSIDHTDNRMSKREPQWSCWRWQTALHSERSCCQWWRRSPFDRLGLGAKCPDLLAVTTIDNYCPGHAQDCILTERIYTE